MDHRSPPPSFGLIAEGPCDHAIIRRILCGFFDDAAIDPSPLQPLPGSEGGWAEVLRYCGSENFVGAFEWNDFVIIQIDTDVCEEPRFGVSRRDERGVERSVDDLAQRVQERLISAMGRARYDTLRERIIFAICIDSIECWLLPLFYQDARQAKTVNCLRSLNQALPAALGFSIDESRKQVRLYHQVLRRYPKRKDLDSYYQSNPSLALFVAALQKTKATSPPSSAMKLPHESSSLASA